MPCVAARRKGRGLREENDMKKRTQKSLLEEGYTIENAQITNVSLNMENHGCLCLDLTIEWDGCGCVYGGYCLGKGYVGANDDFFSGSEKGLEAIMRIMDTVGQSELSKLKGQYIRVAHKGWGSSVKIIGNIVKDKWFDYEKHFEK